MALLPFHPTHHTSNFYTLLDIFSVSELNSSINQSQMSEPWDFFL